MKSRSLACSLIAALFLALPAQAKELKFAFQGTLNSLDPYNLNETFHLGFQGNIYAVSYTHLTLPTILLV